MIAPASGRLSLTVLGSSCSIPRPGRACSSYLVEHGGHAVLADLGTGAFANFIARRTLEQLSAVVISHMHADHFLDIVPLRYALKYGERRRADRLPVYLPPGGEAMLRALAAAFHPEVDDHFLESVFELRTYAGDDRLTFGELGVTFAPTTHYIECYAMRFEAGGRSIAYSADTAPDERVVALARGAEIFLCEASLSPEAERDEPRGHSSAREAGRMAAAAGARSLVLSHYPAAHDPERMRADARAGFAGEITVADDGSVFEITRG